MLVNEFQKTIKDILYGEKGHGLSIYCCLKKDGVFSLKRFNVKDEFRADINNLIANSISSQFLSEDAVYDSVDNVSDDSNVLYLIESTKHYNPFKFLAISKSSDENFTENDREYLFGFVFYFSIDSKVLWAYQHVYPTSISKKLNGLFAVIGNESIFDKIDNKKIFCIESRVDIVVIGKTICPGKIKILEQYFGFEVYIRSEAQRTIEIIEETKLIKNIEKFNTFIAKAKLTNAKKLLKIKNSPILAMSANIVTQRISEIPRYGNIKIENKQIIVETEKDIVGILKMLNDDFLRSELSQKEYDSPSKKILPDS